MVSSSSSFNHFCFGLFLRMQELKRSEGAVLSRSPLIPIHSSPRLLHAVPGVLALVGAAVNYLRLLLAHVQLPTKGKWSHSERKTTNWGLLFQWFLHCDMPGRSGGLHRWIVIFKNVSPKIRWSKLIAWLITGFCSDSPAGKTASNRWKQSEREKHQQVRIGPPSSASPTQMWGGGRSCWVSNQPLLINKPRGGRWEDTYVWRREMNWGGGEERKAWGGRKVNGRWKKSKRSKKRWIWGRTQRTWLLLVCGGGFLLLWLLDQQMGIDNVRRQILSMTKRVVVLRRFCQILSITLVGGVVRHTCSCSPDHEPHTLLTSHCSPSQETSYVSMSSGFCWWNIDFFVLFLEPEKKITPKWLRHWIKTGNLLTD